MADEAKWYLWKWDAEMFPYGGYVLAGEYETRQQAQKAMALRIDYYVSNMLPPRMREEILFEKARAERLVHSGSRR